MTIKQEGETTMDKDEIFKKVRLMLMYMLNLKENEIELKSNLIDDLAMDSLDCVEVMMHIDIDLKLDIEIPDEVAEKCTTVNDIVEAVYEGLALREAEEAKKNKKIGMV